MDFTGRMLPPPHPELGRRDYHARRLEIGAGDELVVNEGIHLNLHGGSHPFLGTTEIVNAGQLSLSRVPRGQYGTGELLLARTTISGGGTINLGTGPDAAQGESTIHALHVDFSYAAPIINQDNLIRGRGLLNGPLHNKPAGRVSADVNVTGAKLVLDGGGFGQTSNGVATEITTNEGRFEAKDGGTLQLILTRLLNVGAGLCKWHDDVTRRAGKR